MSKEFLNGSRFNFFLIKCNSYDLIHKGVTSPIVNTNKYHFLKFFLNKPATVMQNDDLTNCLIFFMQ